MKVNMFSLQCDTLVTPSGSRRKLHVVENLITQKSPLVSGGQSDQDVLNLSSEVSDVCFIPLTNTRFKLLNFRLQQTNKDHFQHNTETLSKKTGV